MRHLVAGVALACALVVLMLAPGWALGGEEPPAFEPVVVTVEVDRTHQGKNVDWWARRAVQARKDANARGRTIKRLKRVLAHDPNVREAIALAALVYDVDERMLRRKAWCESRFKSTAKNRRSSARGLFQFLTEPDGGTWATTPFGRFSVWSPYANALAAGWMHSAKVGRGREWVCR